LEAVLELIWIPLVQASVSLIWIALALLLVRQLFLRAHSSWLRVRDTFGVGGTRTLALVCTSVLFMGSVPDFIRVPLRFLFATVISVPLHAVELAPGADAELGVPSTSLQAGSQTALLLMSNWREAFKCFHDELPYVQLAFFFMVWFAASRALNNILPPAEGSSPGEGRSLSRMLQGMELSRWVLVFLLITGLALCVASITTVTQLSDKGDSDNKSLEEEVNLLAEKLKASKEILDEPDYPYGSSNTSKESQEMFEEAFDNGFSNQVDDALALLKTDLHEVMKKAGGVKDPETVLTIQAQLSLVMELRQQLQTIWRMMGKLSASRYDRATADALTEYEVSNNSRYGKREQRQQFLDIVAWHRQSRHKLRSTVEQCKTQVISTETYWAEWASNMRVLLQLQATLPQQASMDPPKRASMEPIGLVSTRVLRSPLLHANKVCQAAPLDPVPRRVDFGNGLGPLRPIAGWLMKTESVQLALIIGMLGAGLLGSAVASFMRTQGRKQTEGQLTGVVVRGVTAAIVTFLAVQGGLSTVAVSDNGARLAPNPHLLLLICFVAAVYSEQVWNAALQRLMKQLGPEGETSKPTEPAPPAVTGPAVPALATAPTEAQSSRP
jgi:hypothetical protein